MNKKVIFIGIGILVCAVSLVIIKMFALFPRQDKPGYIQLYNKQSTTFALPSMQDSIAWARVKEFIAINQPDLYSGEECIVMADKIERRQFPEGYGRLIIVTRQRKADSSRYNVKIVRDKKDDSTWEKKMALYMATGISKNDFMKSR